LTPGLPLITLCIIGCILRVFNLDHQSMWFDEIASLVSAQQPTVIEVVKTTLVTERMPPLYPLCLHFWTSIFGYSEFALRIPSVLFGILSIPVLYLLTTTLFNKRVALIASFLLVVSPFHIWYSQEARGFTLTVLLNLLSVFFFLKIIDNKNSASHKSYLPYFATTCCALYTNYLVFFTLVAQNVVFLYHFIKNKPSIRSWLIVQTSLILLCMLPLLTLFVKQVVTGYQMHYTPQTHSANSESQSITPGTSSDTIKGQSQTKVAQLVKLFNKRFTINIAGGINFLSIHIPASFSSGLKYVNRPPFSWSQLFLFLFVYPVGILFILLCIRGVLSTRKIFGITLLLLLIIPISGVVLIKLFSIRPVYTRHVIQVLPLYYIFIACGLSSLQSITAKSVISTCILLSMMFSLSIYYFDKKTYKDDWRYIAQHISSQLKKEDYLLFHGELAKASFYYYIALDASRKNMWKTEKPDHAIVRQRDRSFSQFFTTTYKNVLKEKKRIWVVTYYALEDEATVLHNYLEKDFKLIEKNHNLGRDLCVELFENKNTII